LPRKHDIIDLKRALEESAPPEEIREIAIQLYEMKLERDKSVKEKKEA
jgi:hypothetical protein